jgi:hypothetical protein
LNQSKFSKIHSEDNFSFIEVSLSLQEAHEEGSQDDRGILIIRWTSEESGGGKDLSKQAPNIFRKEQHNKG